MKKYEKSLYLQGIIGADGRMVLRRKSRLINSSPSAPAKEKISMRLGASISLLLLSVIFIIIRISRIMIC